MIYVTGDMHADIERFNERALKRLKAGDTLIILGDFGFIWRGGEQETKNLEFIKNRKYNVLFLEGTHENFDLLHKYPQADYCGGKVVDLGGNLKMLCRGEIYDIEDKKIFALGGGQSDDIEFRKEGESWWQCELPSAEEIERAEQNLKAVDNKVDFILTHTAPQKLRTSILGKEDEADRLCAFFDKIMISAKYQRWFFGFFHIDRKLTRMHYAVYRKVLEITTPEKKGFFAKLIKKNK